jgi:hypothetical protein
MRRVVPLYVFMLCLTACLPVKFSITTFPIEGQPTHTATPEPAFTAIPSFTPAPTGGIALDFVAQLCDAKWSNGAQALTACPISTADQSGGLAAPLDPIPEGLPAGTPVLLTIPGWNGSSALFLRYPAITVQANDHFRATLRCKRASACDVQFGLEYFDSAGDYHNAFMVWNYKSGDASISADADLTTLAGQPVEFVLVLRVSHTVTDPGQDNGLWIAPQIFRPEP